MPKLKAALRVKNHRSATNAKPRKVFVKFGGNSHVLRHAEMDERTEVGQAVKTEAEALARHVGEHALTRPLETLCHQGARFKVLASIAWAHLEQHGIFYEGALNPAFDAFRRASAAERSVLLLLGLERRQKPVPTLEEYLREVDRRHADSEAPGEPEGADRGD